MATIPGPDLNAYPDDQRTRIALCELRDLVGQRIVEHGARVPILPRPCISAREPVAAVLSAI
jgi:hypothetical protein